MPARATVTITAVTALAWIVTSLVLGDPEAALVFGFIPARFAEGVTTNFAAVPAFLTPLTSAFVHGGLLHLAFNMLMLVWCGAAVERVLGAGSLVLLYIAGAYAAAFAQWMADPLSAIPMIGASGAVSAVIGAFALSFGRPRRFTHSARVNRWINALWLMVAWVFLQVAIGWLAGGQGYLLATPAHIGGFLAGLLLQRPLLEWRYRSA